MLFEDEERQALELRRGRKILREIDIDLLDEEHQKELKKVLLCYDLLLLETQRTVKFKLLQQKLKL